MLCLHSDVGFATTAAGTGAQGDRGTWETLSAGQGSCKTQRSIHSEEGRQTELIAPDCPASPGVSWTRTPAHLTAPSSEAACTLLLLG